MHLLLQEPEKITKNYERVPEAKPHCKLAYAAMVESIDNSFGRVLDALRASGKEDGRSLSLPSTTVASIKPPATHRSEPTKELITGRHSRSLDHPMAGGSRTGRVILEPVIQPAKVEFYNLCQDLVETTNLVQVELDRRSELSQDLEVWRVALGAERMKPNPDAASKVNREDTIAR